MTFSTKFGRITSTWSIRVCKHYYSYVRSYSPIFTINGFVLYVRYDTRYGAAFVGRQRIDGRWIILWCPQPGARDLPRQFVSTVTAASLFAITAGTINGDGNSIDCDGDITNGDDHIDVDGSTISPTATAVASTEITDYRQY